MSVLRAIFNEAGYSGMTQGKTYTVHKISFWQSTEPGEEFHSFLVADDTGTFTSYPDFLFRIPTKLDKVLK